MIKDLFVSFTENIKTKTSNPFFGTLVIVWFTKNWNLIYSVFNFDPKATLEDKRKFIDSHFTALPLIETLGWCIIETFIILVISYILINLTRLIVNFFEKKITPLVYKWTDNSSIVLKSAYDELENERKKLEKRVDEDRDTKQKLQAEIEKLELKLVEKRLETNGAINSNDNTEFTEKNGSKDNNQEKIKILTDNFKRESLNYQYDDIVSAIRNSKSLDRNEATVQNFSKLGLISRGDYDMDDRFYYYLTPLGEKLHDSILLDTLK